MRAERACEVGHDALDGEVEAQVDHAVVARALGRDGRREAARRADEGAAPDFPSHQPAALGLGIGACHRADGDAERVGELAVGGETLARTQPTAGDVVSEGVGDADVARGGVSRRSPVSILS